MKIVVVGAGGREHAIAYKLAQSPLVDAIFAIPGNGGTAHLPKTANVDIDPADFPALVQFAIANAIDLVVPGPEQPLVDGIEYVFRKGMSVGIPVFGPSANAARMEGSKAFAKAFMFRHAIDTAVSRTFPRSDFAAAAHYIRTCGHPVVLKASGLAAGKGVLIPADVDEAVADLEQIMVHSVFGDAGSEVVIEERLTGPEISVLAFSDGYTVVPLPAAQDHKRIGEGDTGPNTGGMGAYAPAPVATPQIMDQIVKTALQPSIDGMRKEGFPFVGLLFTGFMLTEDGPKVLEYNVRFGDPETEALMLLLSPDTDLAAVMLACVEHRLDSVSVSTRRGFAVSVVLASEGYPGSYSKNHPIAIGTVPQDTVVFHAGTKTTSDGLVTSGGRVIAVSAYASTLEGALKLAYEGVDAVQFSGKVFRRDIAHRAIQSIAPTTDGPGLTYAAAGVSVDAGNELVSRIKPYVKRTLRPGADGSIGGFGGVFDLSSTGFKDPLLVSGTDGVGTKLRVAMDVGKHDWVGIDLVAMSVNDLIVQGAEPLYFLDYYGCAKLDVDVAASVVQGVAEGCIQAGCALIGGETAEMPGMYHDGDYDLAGFAVGAVERRLLLPRSDIEPGDLVIGLASSGLHSNGFSLVRKIIARCSLSYASPCPWSPTQTLGESLLTPTRIYIKQLLPLIRKALLKGMVHITGGGFIENIPRALPEGTGCFIDANAWPYPDVFKFLSKHGNVAPIEMARTFNNGIGMVLIAAPGAVDEAFAELCRAGESPVILGEITRGAGVQMRNLDSWVN